MNILHVGDTVRLTGNWLVDTSAYDAEAFAKQVGKLGVVRHNYESCCDVEFPGHVGWLTIPRDKLDLVSSKQPDQICVFDERKYDFISRCRYWDGTNSAYVLMAEADIASALYDYIVELCTKSDQTTK